MKGLVQLCLVFVYLHVTKATSPQPNIVIILADDMGWDDIGYNSNEISTPNLDRLSSQGVRFERYYTQPVCTPSRTSIMTGRYPIHTGMQDSVIDKGEPWGVGLNETFLSQQLKQVGYKTHCVGKWHMGYHMKEYTPTYRGFDSFYGYYHSESDYFDHKSFYRHLGLDLHDNEMPDWSQDGVYNTELFTQKADGIIQDHNIDDPLFLYLAYEAPHVGWRSYPPINDKIQAPQEWIDKFQHIPHIGRRKYVANVAYLDYSVGEVYKSLERKGILDNTIVLFISDNGAEPNGFRANWGSNFPLRGSKFSLFEGGMRVPGFITSKLLNDPGRTSTELIHVTDWYPTLLHLAGSKIKQQNLDGTNQWKAIQNISCSSRLEILLNIESLTNSSGLIDGSWKAVKQGKINVKNVVSHGERSEGVKIQEHEKVMQDFDGWCVPPTAPQYKPNKDARFPECFTQTVANDCANDYCLFNLKDDPNETNDLSKAYPSVLKNMIETIEKYRKSQVPSRIIRRADELADPIHHNNSFEPWITSE